MNILLWYILYNGFTNPVMPVMVVRSLVVLLQGQWRNIFKTKNRSRCIYMYIDKATTFFYFAIFLKEWSFLCKSFLFFFIIIKLVLLGSRIFYIKWSLDYLVQLVFPGHIKQLISDYTKASLILFPLSLQLSLIRVN